MGFATKSDFRVLQEIALQHLTGLDEIEKFSISLFVAWIISLIWSRVPSVLVHGFLMDKGPPHSSPSVCLRSSFGIELVKSMDETRRCVVYPNYRKLTETPVGLWVSFSLVHTKKLKMIIVYIRREKAFA